MTGWIAASNPVRRRASSRAPWRAAPRSAALAAALLIGAGAVAAPIYSCVDADGKRLTSDRPIAACMDREQRIYNQDGSVRQVVAPPLTAEQRSARDAREREIAAERAARQDAMRRDRTLLTRYPDEASHRKAREAALESARESVRASEARLADLAKERKPLITETEFYAGKPLPAKLKSQLEANEVTAEAQRTLMANQQLEILRIEMLYDAQLERLKKLWAGAPPGSLGMLADSASAPPRK